MSDPGERTRTITEIKDRSVSVPDVRVTITPPDGADLHASLGLTSIVVGTSSECDLTVTDPGVSRRHCALALTERGIILKDLKSKNGTFIGSIRITEAMLEIDMIAKVGSSQLVARVVGSPSTLPLAPEPCFGDALGKSLVMRAMFHRLGQAASSNTPILLVGEPGTGKRTLAEAIHRASLRSSAPFVVFDPSTVDPGVMAAELLGDAPTSSGGAVPGAPGLLKQARGGTLYIDEPAEMPQNIQVILLWALRSTSAIDLDVRVIAATRQDLRSRVANGSFRADLHQWLAGIEATVPPLRERKGDIRLLIECFLKKMAPPQGPLPAETMELLEAHSWPGNVRELREMVEQLAVCAYLGERTLFTLIGPEPGGAALLGLLYQKELDGARADVVDRFEKSYLKAKLEEHKGNIPEMARAIGVRREHVYRLLKKHGLSRKE